MRHLFPLLILVLLTGCASLKSLQLDKYGTADIFPIPTGTVCGKHIAEKDGFFCSYNYLFEVLQADTQLK